MASIYLANVPLQAQATPTSCWLAAAEMIFDYFDTVEGIYPPLKQWAADVKRHRRSTSCDQRLAELFMSQQGMTSKYFDDLCENYGLQKVTPPRGGLWTVAALAALLAQFGPLYLAMAINSLVYHAVVAVGVDTTQSRVYCNDPDPVEVGSLRYWTEDQIRPKLAPATGAAVFVFSRSRSTPIMADDVVRNLSGTSVAGSGFYRSIFKKGVAANHKPAPVVQPPAAAFGIAK